MEKLLNTAHWIIVLTLGILVILFKFIDRELYWIFVNAFWMYWGLVFVIWAFVSLYYLIRDKTIKGLLFDFWLYGSLFVGLAGISIALIYGAANEPFTIVMIIYGGLVYIAFKNKID